MIRRLLKRLRGAARLRVARELLDLKIQNKLFAYLAIREHAPFGATEFELILARIDADITRLWRRQDRLRRLGRGR